MAKPNYSFEKRQRELARKKKKEEKSQRKSAKRDEPAAVTDESPSEAPVSAGAGDVSGNT